MFVFAISSSFSIIMTVYGVIETIIQLLTTDRFLYDYKNNNKDSKNVGWTANMDYTYGKCKIFAYIKKNANKEFVSKNEL